MRSTWPSGRTPTRAARRLPTSSQRSTRLIRRIGSGGMGDVFRARNAAGDVGDVGGVAQKTVAVENAGASIFLVPPQEYGAAMSKDRPGLKIYAVSTLDQALRVLEANGGRVGPTALDAASSGSAG